MTEPTSKTSPFVIAASIAVILVSIVGIGVMTGLIPGRGAKPEIPAATAPGQMAGTPAPQLGGAAEKPAAADKTAAAQPEPVTKPAAKRVTVKPAAHSTASVNPEQKVAVKVCGNCGIITAIRTVEQAGEGSGLGAVAGGVVGGLLGHQVGGGTGKDLATIAGVVGGGYAGHQIEKKVKTTKHYEINVRMDDGSHRTFMQETEPAYAVGEKVKVIDGALIRD
ncbi:MAG TPA: glycine zipper 2TM domain-containing protein [Sulfuricella sp.]|nr:glycine zipper 2TM domain-containing protein [Sulfuricella sp.]